jgi:hypothetical protein
MAAPLFQAYSQKVCRAIFQKKPGIPFQAGYQQDRGLFTRKNIETFFIK